MGILHRFVISFVPQMWYPLLWIHPGWKEIFIAIGILDELDKGIRSGSNM